MHHQRTIAAAADVVLARPHMLDRRGAAERLARHRRLDRIAHVGRRAAAETAPGILFVQRHAGERHAEHFRHRGGVADLELAARVEIGPARARLDHRVHRLHRRVREEREDVGRLDLLRRARDRRGGVAVRLALDPGIGVGRLVVGDHSLARPRFGLRQIPVDGQRLAALHRGERVLGIDDDALRDRLDRDDAGHRQRRLVVDRLNRAAERGRVLDHADDHAGPLHVHRELRRAGRFDQAVDLGHVGADQRPLLGGLERGLLRHRHRRGERRQVAEARLFGAVADDTLGHLDLAGGNAPLLGRRGDQHRARRSAGVAHLHPAIGHRGRPASAHRAERQVLVERVVGRRELDAHLGPIGIHFVGDDRGQSGRRALAELDMLDDDADGVVGQHADERVGGEGSPGGERLRAAHRQRQPEHEPSPGEELAAIGGRRVHAGTLALAASLIAWRMRT